MSFQDSKEHIVHSKESSPSCLSSIPNLVQQSQKQAGLALNTLLFGIFVRGFQSCDSSIFDLPHSRQYHEDIVTTTAHLLALVSHS